MVLYNDSVCAAKRSQDLQQTAASNHADFKYQILMIVNIFKHLNVIKI